MMSRRQMMLGLGPLLLGAGTTTASALNSSAEVSGDFRVLVVVDLTLTPGRDSERYVETDASGLVEAIVLDGTDAGVDGINRRARTRFEELVRLTNNGNGSVTELYFEFEVEDTGLEAGDPTAAEIEAALQIVSAEDEIDATGDVNFLGITESAAVDDGQLDPGESLTFGTQIDLRPDVGAGSISTLPASDRFDVTLNITAEMEA